MQGKRNQCGKASPPYVIHALTPTYPICEWTKAGASTHVGVGRVRAHHASRFFVPSIAEFVWSTDS